MRKRRARPEREQIPFELPMPVPFELPKSKEGEVVLLVAELLLAVAEDDRVQVSS